MNLIAGGDIAFVVNTPQGQGGGARSDGEQIRKAAITYRVSSVTTVEAALAAVQGMAEKSRPRPLRAFAAGVPRVSGVVTDSAAPASGRWTLPNPVMTASGTAGPRGRVRSRSSTLPTSVRTW